MASKSDMFSVPAFTYDVATWILHIEAAWADSTDLTDLQRYRAVVRALPSEVVGRLSSLLAKPPSENKYEAIKSALQTAFGSSNESYFSALDTMRFDGGRPSALLARMTDINRASGHPLSDAMLRYRHANLMPHPVRVQLAAVRKSLSMVEYSELADTVYAAHMASFPPPPCYHSCGAGGQDKIDPMHLSSHASPETAALHNIQARPGPTRGRTSLSRSPTSTESRLAAVEASLQRLEATLAGSTAAPRPRYCFYHARFGAEARNCQPPCAWSGNRRRGGW